MEGNSTAVLEGGTSASLADVGVPSAATIGSNVAQLASLKPIPYGALGHYRLSYRAVLASAQAANSRLFTLRNAGTNLIVLTRLILRALQIGAGTPQENSLDCFKLTAFTVLDTTNTVTPSASAKRASMAAAPGNAQIRGVTQAGIAAGMTGGTMTKDGSPFATLPFNLAAAASTAYQWGPLDCVDDVNGTHPFVFSQNEGFDVENRVLNVTSYGIAFYLDCSFAEVPAF